MPFVTGWPDLALSYPDHCAGRKLQGIQSKLNTMVGRFHAALLVVDHATIRGNCAPRRPVAEGRSRPTLYLPPMVRSAFILAALLVLGTGCKKEEVKKYNVTLEASCWDCIVQYAVGPERGRFDTLFGSVVDGDTIPETGTYTVVVEAEQAIFFRGCRMDPDTVFGDIELMASGEVAPLEVRVDTSQNCAVINQAVQVR